MKTERCEECGEFFWADHGEGLCPTCKEAPSARENSERAVEQWLAYIQSLRAKERGTKGGEKPETDKS